MARGVRADLHCYNSLIAGYAARGKAAEADALLKSMAREKAKSSNNLLVILVTWARQPQPP